MTKSASLLLISHEYPPYVFGGIAYYSQQLAEWLGNKGWKVYVVTGKAGHKEGLKIEKRENVTIIRVYFPDIPPRWVLYAKIAEKYITFLINKGIRLVLSNNLLTGLIPSLRRHKVKTYTIHHGTVYAIMPFFESAPYIVNTNLNELIYYAGYPLLKTWQRKDINYSDFNIFVANHLKLEAEQLYPELISKIRQRSAVIYPGVEYKHLQILRQAYPRQRKRTLIVVFVGRLYYTKGITYAVETIETLYRQGYKKIQLWVFGTGPLRNWVIKKSRQLPVKYFGFVKRERLLTLMATHADVLLHPSLYEGAPMTIIEAQALGIPVVTFDLSWTGEFIIHGVNGYKVPLQDPQQLAEALLKAVELSPEKVALTAMRFDKDVTYSAFEKLLEKAIYE